ncbi:MAG TPA: DUF899 family protein [Myxococcota bacterium]|nr:DUF899 family protein [Myxococcota bacterium]
MTPETSVLWNRRRDPLRVVRRDPSPSAAKRSLQPLLAGQRLFEKPYVFDGTEGKRSLGEIFGGRHQLIVYHFMFDPEWEKGCTGCTGYVDALGNLSMLNDRDTTFVLVSRAPLAKLEAYKALKGWKVAWYSSFGSDFNYDFHVTLDENFAPVKYNYRSKAEMQARRVRNPLGEEHGLSVFFRVGDVVFHTYSTYARCPSRKSRPREVIDVFVGPGHGFPGGTDS